MKFYKFVDPLGDYLYHKSPLLGRILSYFIQYAVSCPNVLMSSLILYFQLLLDLSVPNIFRLENHDAEKD
jgi:hypothetical protein